MLEGICSDNRRELIYTQELRVLGFHSEQNRVIWRSYPALQGSRKTRDKMFHRGKAEIHSWDLGRKWYSPSNFSKTCQSIRGIWVELRRTNACAMCEMRGERKIRHLEVYCTGEPRNVVRTKGRHGFIWIGAGWKLSSVLRAHADQCTQTANVFKNLPSAWLAFWTHSWRKQPLTLPHACSDLQGIHNYFKRTLNALVKHSNLLYFGRLSFNFSREHCKACQTNQET